MKRPAAPSGRGSWNEGHSLAAPAPRLTLNGGRPVKRLFAAAVLISAMSAAAAQGAEIFEKVGTYDATFLKIGVGARAAGMGDAYTAIADDGTATFWNAAGVARVERTEISLNHNSWVGGLLEEHFAYVFNLKQIPG